MNPDAKTFIEGVEAARKQALEYAGFINRLKSRLLRAEKALAEKPAILSTLSKLISDLQAMKSQPDQPRVTQLIESLEQQLQKVRQRFHDSFPVELRQQCEAAQLHFVSLQDGFGVGPFYVTVNVPKELASFHYAKVSAGAESPLSRCLCRY